MSKFDVPVYKKKGMLPADQELPSGARGWGGDIWGIPPPDPLGSGVPLAPGTSHRRHGNSGVALGLCSALYRHTGQVNCLPCS